MKDITRQEIKYMLDRSLYEQMISELMPYLTEDSYHCQKIHNVYFDNDANEIIRTSIEKPRFKEKLRIRAYESDGYLYDYAYIELKKKFKGTVYKRRLQLDLAHGKEFLKGGALALGDSQIAREIMFYQQKTNCYPKVYLSYDRASYRGKDDASLRITFDTNLLYRTTDLSFTHTYADRVHLGFDRRIMEIKANGAFPLWLTALLTKFKCYPVSYSKYGSIYLDEICSQQAQRRACICLTA